MTVPSQENQPQTADVQSKESTSELNFRRQAALYERKLEQERQARLEAERRALELEKRTQRPQEDDSDSSEPYVDDKRLTKKLDRFKEELQPQIDAQVEARARALMQQEKRNDWMKRNPDFEDVLSRANEFAKSNPDEAEDLLELPDGFERHKAVYRAIKRYESQKQEKLKESDIQKKVDQNQRNPYYVPSGVVGGPFGMQSDFSQGGQQRAYEKMQALKKNLRIG